MPLTKIATQLGVTKTTLNVWIKDGKRDQQLGIDSLKAQLSASIHDGWHQLGNSYLSSIKHHAANGSTQAATWFLTHHPYYRDDFSDAAADRRVEKRTVASVIDAIVAAGLPPEQEKSVLLQIQARGLTGDQPMQYAEGDLANEQD